MKAASNVQVGASPEMVTIQTVGRRTRYMSYSVTPTPAAVEVFGIVGAGQTSLATGPTGSVHCEGYQQIGIQVTGPATIDVDIQFD